VETCSSTRREACGRNDVVLQSHNRDLAARPTRPRRRSGCRLERRCRRLADHPDAFRVNLPSRACVTKPRGGGGLERRARLLARLDGGGAGTSTSRASALSLRCRGPSRPLHSREILRACRSAANWLAVDYVTSQATPRAAKSRRLRPTPHGPPPGGTTTRPTFPRDPCDKMRPAARARAPHAGDVLPSNATLFVRAGGDD